MFGTFCHRMAGGALTRRCNSCLGPAAAWAARPSAPRRALRLRRGLAGAASLLKPCRREAAA